MLATTRFVEDNRILSVNKKRHHPSWCTSAIHETDLSAFTLPRAGFRLCAPIQDKI